MLQVKKTLNDFQPSQPRERSSTLVHDITVKDDAYESNEPEKMREEIFNMIREISQERKVQESRLENRS
jgi:hypothetical protein